MSQDNLEQKLLLIGLLLIFSGMITVFHVSAHSVSIMWVLLLVLALYNLTLRVADHFIATEKHPEELPHYPHLSIIIPAHNEEKVIEETVFNLLKQDYPFFDILVMNDRSTDETANILKKIKESLTENRTKLFSYVTRTPDETPGKSAVLNDALCYTRSEYLLILDADAEVSTDFLKRIMSRMMQSGYGAIQVQRKLIPFEEHHAGSFLVFCQAIEYALDTVLQSARQKLESAVELRGSGMLVRREALYSTNGWTESALTDDLDLSSKLHLTNWPIGFYTEPCVTEQGLGNWQALYKQRIRWAQGSIDRYLKYGIAMFFSFNTSPLLKLDTLIYSITFWIPPFFLLEGLFALATLNGWLLLSWLSAWLVLWLLFMASFLSCQTPLWGEATLFRRIALSATGGSYMIALWVPAIYHAYWRLLTQTAPPQWEQTERS